MDDKTTLQELRQTAQAFVDAREWAKYHTPKNLVMALSVEAAELVEIFQWKSEQESFLSDDPKGVRQHVEEEMADVLAYLLNLANALEIDLSEAFYRKMNKNAGKYPIDAKTVF